MTIATVKSWSKCTQLKLAAKIGGGKHLGMECFEAKFCQEAIICPESHSYFNIDGEIFKNDQAYLKILPGFINMMGKITPLSKDESRNLERYK